jgi:hypothetical protein
MCDYECCTVNPDATDFNGAVLHAISFFDAPATSSKHPTSGSTASIFHYFCGTYRAGSARWAAVGRWPEVLAESAGSSYFSAAGSGGVVFGGARWCVACS